jgi:Lrp/AsnC family leucine-responsive transcriptional regulator
MGQLKKVESAAQGTPEVIECHRVTGEDCYIMKIVVPDIDHLEGIIDRFTPFGSTTTSIIHSSPVPPRRLEPRRDGS